MERLDSVSIQPTVVAATVRRPIRDRRAILGDLNEANRNRRVNPKIGHEIVQRTGEEESNARPVWGVDRVARLPLLRQGTGLRHEVQSDGRMRARSADGSRPAVAIF